MCRRFGYLFIGLWFLLAAANGALAQGRWHSIRQNYWPTSFLSVFFLEDGQSGWAVGWSGTILHTTDGGQNWQNQSSGTSKSLLSVHFANSQNGWAVGWSGTILHTTDGGLNWQDQSSGTSNGLSSVHFADRQNGWAVGESGTILHTTDGGLNWHNQTSGTSNNLLSVHFVDSQNGWAVGYDGTILHTTDGGANWSAQSSGTSEYLSSVHFADSHNGWAVGRSGTVLHTSDGGQNWHNQSSGTGNWLESVHFVDSHNGWAVGNYGTILHTSNGGLNWQEQTSGTSNDLRCIHFADHQNGLAVGYDGTILRTTDGGKNWHNQSSGTINSLYSVHFVDSQNGWAVGELGTILHTTDGGQNWQVQGSGTSNLLFSVHFVDSHNGWAVGWDGTILHTADGGQNWQVQSSGTSNWLESVHFADHQNGWAVGGSGTILHTTDGGQNWQLQSSGTSNHLESVHFADSHNGWAVGQDGVILHTTDGGQNWQHQSSGTSNDLESVHFVDSQNGWAVGELGTILHSTDGGQNWQVQGSGTDNSLESVHFVDYWSGWAVGSDGIVLGYEVPMLVIASSLPAPGPGIPFGFWASQNSISRDWTFQLKNSGRAAFTIDGWQSTNPAFSLSAPSLPQTFEPLEKKALTVCFSPTSSGFYEDSLLLSISGQDTATVYAVPLSAGVLLSEDPLQLAFYNQAVAAYDSARAHNQASPAVHNNLGVLLALLNAPQAASAEFSRVYNNKGTKMNQGVVNVLEQNGQQAISRWKNLLEDVETPAALKPQLHFNLAWVYDEIDSLERAYEYYTYVIGDTLANRRLVAKAYLGRGVTVFKMSRDSSAANENFRQALALDPHGAGVLAQQNMQAILTGVAPGELVKLPQTFALEQNYPNPFNPETLIRYQLPEAARVRLVIYNTLGQRIRVLLDERQPPGYHSIRWDGKDERGRNVGTGVYLCRFQAGDFRQVIKMILVR